MGNSPSYAKVATALWYREGVKSYGRHGFAKACTDFDDLTRATRPEDEQSLLRGRVVLVTGANSGIGFEVALKCACLGAAVHLLCRDATKGAEAASQIQDALATCGSGAAGGTATAHVLDLSDFDAVRSFVQRAAETQTFGDDGIDVLVNNAGCMPEHRQETPQRHEAIVATTLGGAVLLTRLLLPLMKQPHARVINVASGGMYTVAPRVGDLDLPELCGSHYDGALVYAYAKRWMVELTRFYAAHPPIPEAAGVAFYSMHPGWADTPGVQRAMPGFAKRHDLRTAAQGADTAVFLAAAPFADIARAAGDPLTGHGIDAPHPSHQPAKVLVPPANGAFWFDRRVAPFDMRYGGTAWSDAQRAELAAAAARYCGLPAASPDPKQSLAAGLAMERSG